MCASVGSASQPTIDQEGHFNTHTDGLTELMNSHCTFEYDIYFFLSRSWCCHSAWLGKTLALGSALGCLGVFLR